LTDSGWPAAPVAREALFAAWAAALLSGLLLWTGPPGLDLAAHVYQRTLFLRDGLAVWNNFWYAGRYSFVTYSLLYYPLAALLGIKVLAVATITLASAAFAVVVWRIWGAPARWSSRTFPIVWAGLVFSAAFPFALGVALALLALWAIQSRRLWPFALLATLTLAASPVAFVLLAVVLAGIGLGTLGDRRLLVATGSILGVLGLTELALWRLFPSAGRYPFSGGELAAALAFCALATILTWTTPRTRMLRFIFPLYAAGCVVSYAVPSALGENVDRLRYLAIPLALLLLALRDWRPRALSFCALVLAALWNLSPLATSFSQAQSDPAARAAFWAPAVRYLQAHLSPNYRVEALDTIGHWEAVYLPRAGIPLARGWFRQDDFPQNALLYGKPSPSAYLSWLHHLGVAYVVLSAAPPDYSARAEKRLISAGHVLPRLVLMTSRIRIFAVPSPRPIATGPGRASITSLDEDGFTVTVMKSGTYRIAFHSSPYWHSSTGCVTGGPDGMIRLVVASPATVHLSFRLNAESALDALTGSNGSCLVRTPSRSPGLAAHPPRT
jgi:hypothetical protein